MRTSVSTVSVRLVVIAVTMAAMLWALVVQASAQEVELPEEDRRLLLADADTSPIAVRFFDLLPPEDETVDAADDEVEEQIPAPDEDDDAVVHEIGPGESLADVAAAYDIPGADGWRRLYDANPDIDDPNLVEVGTQVRIPDPDEELEARDLPVPPRPSSGTSRGTSRGGGDVWDRLAACESNGNWAANTGNGYYGGLQFSLRSWQAVGGSGMPHQQDRATQIAMGERLRAAQGWGAWPSCARRLGLR